MEEALEGQKDFLRNELSGELWPRVVHRRCLALTVSFAPVKIKLSGDTMAYYSMVTIIVSA